MHDRIETTIESLNEKVDIATMRLNNPDTGNSLNLDMGLTFQRELNSLAGRERIPRALILTGAGSMFSSGGDYAFLQKRAKNTPAENRKLMDSVYRLFLRVRDMPFPVIAAVNGHAVGGGLALAMACDLRIFALEGRYSFNFVKIGLHPGMGSSYLVPAICGLAQAQDLLLTGREIDGSEAMRRGICHEAVPGKDVLNRSREMAGLFAETSYEAVRQCKAGLYYSRNLEETVEYEAASQAENFASDEYKVFIDSVIRRKG